jgi:hypothetical protein
MTRRGRTLVVLALVLALPACSFPGLATPTPVVLPTPNMTLTSIFVPTSTATPPAITVTPIVVMPPAATASPTAAAAIATATLGAWSSRPNGSPVHATRLNVAPTLDGDLADWSGTVYPADQIVYGSARWSGAADLSGSYYVGWDSANLYLAISVRDDTHVQRAWGSKLYLGDDVELQLDLDLPLDYTSTSMSLDDVQLGFSPGDFGSRLPEAYRWYPLSKAGPLSSVTVKARSTDQGYTMEVGLPWSALGITPAAGNSFGMALSLSDDDVAGTAAQQSMVSSVVTRKLLNPTTWGTLVLDEAPGK